MGEGTASAQGGAQFCLAPLPLPPLSLLALCWSWSRIPFFWQMISMCLGLGFPSSGPSPLGTEAPHGLTRRGAGRTRLASGLTIRARLVSVLMTRGALRRGSELGMNRHRRWEGGEQDTASRLMEKGRENTQALLQACTEKSLLFHMGCSCPSSFTPPSSSVYAHGLGTPL